MIRLSRFKLFTGLFLFTSIGSSHATAAIVWQDTFTRTTGPTTLDYTSNGTNDYTVTGGSSAYSLSNNTLSFVDTGSSQGILTISADQYSPATYSTGTSIQFSVDMRVNNLVAGTAGTTSASAPRIGFYHGTVANGSEKFTLGFSHVGGATDQLGFYANASDASQTSATVLGGGTAAGFTFGQYSATATDNDTNDGVNGNSFYRVLVSFTQGQTAVTGSITRLDSSGNLTSDLVTFNRTLAANFNFTGLGTDGFSLFSGQGGTSSVDYDNLSVNVVTAVPEPVTMGALVAASLVAFTGFYRRRTK